MEKPIDVEAAYKEANALLEGHFLLASGNHSNRYLQSAKVLEYPKKAALLTDALASMIRAHGIEVDTVCAPALGGVLAGYELARSLDVRSIFVEKIEGGMALRRGFEIAQGEKVIICDDIITTGGSALKAAQAIEALGGEKIYTYSYGSPMLCRTHAPFAIDEQASFVWLEAYKQTLHDLAFPKEWIEVFWNWIESFSLRMVNKRNLSPMRVPYETIKGEFGIA